ncbi:hypothetical protein QPK87_07455 [Kamptonema cortianum]|nr:hypothetical protein [Oscillatoria laete-virens]MDK3156411.1 hypothetical protein [Kamptonema cortianum]MDL5053908.1 hypothetical protein [Oscillatoria laete-virens NRMC-F 0139]
MKPHSRSLIPLAKKSLNRKYFVMPKTSKTLTHDEIVQMAKEGRQRANKMTKAQRQDALALAMRMIYRKNPRKKANQPRFSPANH